MPTVFNIVLPAFAAILIGFLFGRFRRINIASVTDITLYIGVPALVFVSLVEYDIVLVDAARICAASLLVMLGCLLVAWLVFRLLLRRRHSGLYLPVSAMNSVNLPFPIISLAWGAPGMVAAVMFYIPNNLYIFFFGTWLMARGNWRHNLREVLRQPVVYAAIIGLVLNLLDIGVPSLLNDVLGFIAQMAIPLVLFVLGYNLSQSRMTMLPTTLLASFIRLGVGLGLGLLLTGLLGLEGIPRAVVILNSAMPAAAMTSLLAAKYENEAELVSSVVFVTTLISLVSIPLLLVWLA